MPGQGLSSTDPDSTTEMGKLPDFATGPETLATMILPLMGLFGVLAVVGMRSVGAGKVAVVDTCGMRQPTLPTQI